MTATYREPHPQGAALTTRFHHGRLFAARRVAGRPFAVRWAYALATMVLPALMSVRALRHVPATLGVTPATLGWVAAMSTAWAGGEFVGYATGSIGRSLDSWR